MLFGESLAMYLFSHLALRMCNEQNVTVFVCSLADIPFDDVCDIIHHENSNIGYI